MIKPNTRVLVHSKTGMVLIGEAVSWPDPETGRTFVRLVPNEPTSARWIKTSRLVPLQDMDLYEHVLDCWAFDHEVSSDI